MARHSLGGQVGCWIQDHCAQPDGDLRGERFRLTGDQWDFLLNYYELDGRGRFVHERGGLIVGPAKAGKGPFVSAVIAAEAAGGPVLFDALGRGRRACREALADCVGSGRRRLDRPDDEHLAGAVADGRARRSSRRSTPA